MSEPPKWADELRRIHALAESAEQTLALLTRWILEHTPASEGGTRALEPDVEALLETLQTQLQEVRAAETDAFDRYSAAPVAKFLHGQPLTPEEYYLVAAMRGGPWGTAFQLGLSPAEDYDVFQHLWYADEEGQSYINPELPPPVPGRVRGFGVPPERLRRSALRPEQREFFRRHLPEVFGRIPDERRGVASERPRRDLGPDERP